MRPFTYSKAGTIQEAVKQIGAGQDSQFLAGGTTLLDLMKLDVMQPDTLIDINKLAESGVKEHKGGLIIGSLARNSDVSTNPFVRSHYPILAKAIESGASAQLRNMASVGGNIMQKTRCSYFRDVTMPCNKREPGTGCPALTGCNRGHAILGGSDHCVAVHPSDMCVALAALDAVIHLQGESGDRQIPLNDFYLVPGEHPDRENVLHHGELITSVEVPASAFSQHWHYLKVRDRTSFSFALVAVAAMLEIKSGKIAQARLALGGVATKPWRLKQCEEMLVGKAPGKELFHQAAAKSVDGAKGLEHNKFKIELTQRAVARALERAAGGKA